MMARNVSNTIQKEAQNFVCVLHNCFLAVNLIRGVISQLKLLFSIKEGLSQNLKDENAVDVSRITICRNGQVIPSKHIIQTFNSALLIRIKASHLSCPVWPYILYNIQCFKCQHYDPTTKTFRGSFTCVRCAMVGHDGKFCENSES